MKRLNSADVLAMHNIAKGDGRLGKHDRQILAHIARTGSIGNPKTLATSIRLNSGANGVTQRVEKLTTLGYLPAAVKR